MQLSNSCYLSQGNKVDCVLNDLTAAVGGEAAFGVLVAAAIFVSLYIAGNGDLTTPTVALIFIGSVFVPLLPPQFRRIAFALVVVGVAGAGLTLVRKYVLSPAAS